MEVIEKGRIYKVFNYLDKNSYSVIKFISKPPSELDKGDYDGITIEELLRVLIDNLEDKNSKKPGKHTKQMIDFAKSILFIQKSRQKNKKIRKQRYLNEENRN